MTTETMRAVVCHGPFDYRVEEVARPQPGPGEVLVRVGACGLCASDVKCYTGAPLFWGVDGSGGYCEAPVVTGHEFAGTVVGLGEGAAERHGVALEDHVVAEQVIPCGKCRYCKRDQYWMCEPNFIFGFKSGRAEGGMAEYTIFPANSRIHKIDHRLSEQEAAYLEPLACAIHAVEQGGIKPGDTVVTTGIGNIGLCMLQTAKMYNPGQLIAVGTRNNRLELARKLGADVVINVREEDAVARVKALTDGYGCDVCIEASGSVEGPQQAIEMMRRLGTLVAFSSIKEPSLINWNLVGDQKELTVRGSHLGPYCYPTAIAAVASGAIDVKSLITATFPLVEFPAAIEEAQSGRQIKTMVIP